MFAVLRKILFVTCLFYAPFAYAGAVPATCDTNVWDVIGARAWEEANREITQNQNLIAKPDSVLSYICFDSFMDHLANYSENGGPEDPDETGAIIDIFWQLYVLMRQITGMIDPDLTEGLDMNSVLEILILDSLMNNVSLLSVADPDGAQAALCGRGYYIETNFNHNFLGGRSTISAALDDDVDDANYNCSRMMTVWNVARCYDFMSEPSHDGFYTFGQPSVTSPTYVSREAGNSDFRTLPTMCANADSDVGDIICNYYFHGMPSFALGSFWPWDPGTPTIWGTAFPASTPAPGAAGGMDPDTTYLNLLDPTNCASIVPVKTGLVVTRFNGTQYDDAVCLAPGCWYQPGGGVGTPGTCNP